MVDQPTAPNGAIRTPDQRVRVFVSSTLEELAPERQAVQDAITQLRLTPVLFELGARPFAPRELYQAYLEQSDIFVGIYWQRYGWVAPEMDISGLEDEYRLASGTPRLIYVKRPAPDREARLRGLLDHIKADGVSYRGFATPDELRALVADDLAVLLTARFTPGRSVPGASDRFAPLPMPRSAMLGREGELAQLQALLEQPEAGLVTVTGPGGVGKTTLALHAAAAVAPAFADGAVFVSLAALSDPAAIVPAVAAALGVGEAGGRSLEESMYQFVRNKQLLLVLDNVEQLIAAAPLAAQVLAIAPRLTLLVTSREALRVRGEHVVPLQPLPLPEADTTPTEDALEAVPSTALFVARARAANPALRLDAEQARAVVEISRRLDGLPLALELAAARMTVVTPAALLERLERRLPLLDRGARDLPERQRTLRATIAWSYDLLAQPEQALFRQLGVFVGSFTLSAVRGLAGDDVAAGDTLTADDPLDLLATLVDKSLVQPIAAEDEPRFTLLATVQEFALEQLQAQGETDNIRRRHAELYARIAETAAPLLYSPEREAALKGLDRDSDNVRAALGWCLADDAAGGAQDERVSLGLRLAGSLGWYWLMRGRLSEGRGALERALAKAPAGPPNEAHGTVLTRAGLVALAQGDVAAAARFGQAGLAEYQALDLKLQHALAELLLALTSIAGGQLSDAREHLHRGSELHAAAGEPLGAIYEAAVLHHGGRIVRLEGDLARAQAMYEQSLGLYEQLGDTVGSAVVLNALAVVVAQRGDEQRAQALFARSLPLVRSTADRYDLARLLLDVGAAGLRRGNVGGARPILEESLRLWCDIGVDAGVAAALAGLGEVAAALGEREQAGRLLGAAQRLWQSGSTMLGDAGGLDVAATLEAARTRLDDPQFAAGWAAGSATSEQ